MYFSPQHLTICYFSVNTIICHKFFFFKFYKDVFPRHLISRHGPRNDNKRTQMYDNKSTDMKLLFVSALQGCLVVEAKTGSLCYCTVTRCCTARQISSPPPVNGLTAGRGTRIPTLITIRTMICPIRNSPGIYTVNFFPFLFYILHISDILVYMNPVFMLFVM